MGHSGGGAPAIGLALAQQARVAALVLVAPGVPGLSLAARTIPTARNSRARVRRGRPGRLVALGLRTWAAAGADPAAPGADPQRRRGLLRARATIERPDPPAYSRLGEIGVRSVLAIGDLDYPMVRDCAERIAGRHPGLPP